MAGGMALGEQGLAPEALGVGLELADRRLGLPGGDLGLRVRMDTRKPTSLWTSLYGDVSGSYCHLGLKFGWSF